MAQYFRSRPRFGLAIDVAARLFFGSRNRTIEDCFLSSGLTVPTNRLALLASGLLGGLFVKATSLHFTKEALTLHFLFQDSETFLTIVISHYNIPYLFLFLQIL